MKKVFAFLFGGGTTGGQPKDKDKKLGCPPFVVPPPRPDKSSQDTNFQKRGGVRAIGELCNFVKFSSQLARPHHTNQLKGQFTASPPCDVSLYLQGISSPTCFIVLIAISKLTHCACCSLNAMCPA